jgi:hypothetical protein
MKEIMSKYVSSDTDPAALRRERAIVKWLACEDDNAVTNERLLHTHGKFNILPRVSFDHFMSWCTNFIEGIIGVTPPIEALVGSFSGGASTSRSRTASHPAAKYVGKAHVTSRAMETFELLNSEIPLWLGDHDYLQPEVVVGNVLFTVPKKTDIDRVACKEPDLNMFVQKGVGNYFRRCLQRYHINLNDQSINRSLAREGSITGNLATLDLSSASDSVTRELVFQLLPVSWFTLLDSVRSPVTIIDGVEHRNEMFSSMGNGFTFELESLIFFTLARATAFFRGARGSISVYGDDIICPTSVAHDLTWVLKYFGFSVNPDKSFIDGPFRESCGGHYWNGIDITPFYIRKPITELTDLIDVANKLRQWGDRFGGLVDPEVEPIWLWLKELIPSVLWGGVDTSFKYQLASRDAPRMRLSEEVRTRNTGIGGYLHWHNATWERESLGECVATSRKHTSLGRVRVRKARVSTVDQLHSYFYHEIR